MPLPLNWSSGTNGVSPENLMRTMTGPFSRLVDASLGADVGTSHTTLQAAWNAASEGDSIFVKPGTYGAGLSVSSGAGNLKHNITIVCDFGWHRNNASQARFTAPWTIVGAKGLRIYGAVVKGATGSGFALESLEDSKLVGCVAEDPTVDGFSMTKLKQCHLVGCVAETPGNRGFLMYDDCWRNVLDYCEANDPVSNGFGLDAFPTTNTMSEWNWLRSCLVRDGGGHGFSATLKNSGATNGWQHLFLEHCAAVSNAGDGFNFSNGAADSYLTLGDCEAFNNTSAGFRVGGTNPDSRWAATGNRSRGNGAGNWLGTWSGVTGYAINGLSAPGTNVQ